MSLKQEITCDGKLDYIFHITAVRLFEVEAHALTILIKGIIGCKLNKANVPLTKSIH